MSLSDVLYAYARFIDVSVNALADVGFKIADCLDEHATHSHRADNPPGPDWDPMKWLMSDDPLPTWQSTEDNPYPRQK